MFYVDNNMVNKPEQDKFSTSNEYFNPTLLC